MPESELVVCLGGTTTASIVPLTLLLTSSFPSLAMSAVIVRDEPLTRVRRSKPVSVCEADESSENATPPRSMVFITATEAATLHTMTSTVYASNHATSRRVIIDTHEEGILRSVSTSLGHSTAERHSGSLRGSGLLMLPDMARRVLTEQRREGTRSREVVW